LLSADLLSADLLSGDIFAGHLKLSVTARELYVLDNDRVHKVDRETGVIWPLSIGMYLADGHPTSIGMLTLHIRKD